MSLPVELRCKHCPDLQRTGFWNCCFGKTILRFRGVEEEGKKGRADLLVYAGVTRSRLRPLLYLLLHTPSFTSDSHSRHYVPLIHLGGDS